MLLSDAVEMLRLPDELLLCVLARLEPPVLCAVRSCDCRLRALASDSALWEGAHRGRWQRPALGRPPPAGWFADFARRHAQDARLPFALQMLRALARLPSLLGRGERDRVWAQLMAPGVELYDAAARLAMLPDSCGGSAGERDEALKLLRGLNQNAVRIEWEALLERADGIGEEADSDWLGGGESTGGGQGFSYMSSHHSSSSSLADAPATFAAMGEVASGEEADGGSRGSPALSPACRVVHRPAQPSCALLRVEDGALLLVQ